MQTPNKCIFDHFFLLFSPKLNKAKNEKHNLNTKDKIACDNHAIYFQTTKK